MIGGAVYHVEFSAKKTREWLRLNIYLVLAVFWSLITLVVLFFWDHPAPLLVTMLLYLIIVGSLITNRAAHHARKVRLALSILESRDEKNESELYKMLASIALKQEEIMAIGNETRAALTELREAIATETDQAVERIIAATNADAATAEAIREAVADVKNIIPDDVEETDVPAVQDPEEGGDDEETPVDPEELPGDDQP